MVIVVSAGEEELAGAETAATNVFGDDAEIAMRSWSRPVARLKAQRSVQHGIDACIATIPLPGRATQHAPTVGIAMTKTSKATVIDVAKRLVCDGLSRVTIKRTPWAISVFQSLGCELVRD
jgi:hypothetical protein